MNASRLAFVIAMLGTTLAAQQQRGEPIDFMTIVIEGKETLFLPKSLVKHPPEPPPPYTQRELDSINPLEKTPLFRSEPPEYQRRILQPSDETLALTAHAGLYGFAGLDALYQTQVDRYTLDLRGTLDRGGPYRPNADYFRTHFRALARTATQAAPDAPRMMSNGMLDVQTRAYQLFAVPSAPERSAQTIALMLEQQYSGSTTLPYHAAFELHHTRLRQMDSSTTNETELRARATSMPVHVDNIVLGARAELSVRNYRGAALHFHTLALAGMYSDSIFAVEAQLGAQLGTTSWRTTEFTPLADVRARWRIMPWLWLDGRIQSSMAPVYFRNELAHCPYLSDTAAIGLQLSPYQLDAEITIIPSPQLQVSATVQLSSFSEAPYAEPQGDGTFALRYASWTQRTIELRSSYTPDSQDFIRAMVRVLDATFDNGSRVPYRPEFTADIEYGKAITERLIASIRTGYVSSRRASAQRTDRLQGYLVIAARGEYRLNSVLSVTAMLDNLTG
ncbi:MAG: hypothetical protein D6747_04065, partial [Chlorobiota bacterium]